MGGRTAAIALALAVAALPACSGGGKAEPPPAPASSSASASPTASPPPSPSGRVHPAFVAKTACEAITEPELRIVLGAREVERPVATDGDDTVCTFVASPAAKDSPVVHVRLFAGTAEYRAALGRSSGRPTHLTRSIGDEAFFDDLTLYVRVGDRAFMVFASTEEDVDKTSLDMAGRTAEGYRDMALRAAEVLVFRV